MRDFHLRICIKKQDISKGCRGEPSGKNSFRREKWKATSLTACQCRVPFAAIQIFLCASQHFLKRRVWLWGCCRWVLGRGGKSGALQLECKLALCTQNSSRQRPALLSAHSRHQPEERALLLKASRAIADPHHIAQRGPAIQGRCAESLEQASGHLPAPNPHLVASLCSKYLSYIILIRTDVTLYF